VRVRSFAASYAARVAAIDIGQGNERWRTEVREIVAGLPGWVADPGSTELDRRVVVLIDDDDEIVGVSAHEATRTESGRIYIEHRYLMVTAVTQARQRRGLAMILARSVILSMRSNGAKSVTWLVHPRNQVSLQFCRAAFPEADESTPPEDKPYVTFTLVIG
jgi:Acetyltransferase (GNAT) family